MNRYKYINCHGKHVIGGPIVGVVYSDAITHAKCPKCNSDPGYYCVTPAGRKAASTHGERASEMFKTIPVAKFRVQAA